MDKPAQAEAQRVDLRPCKRGIRSLYPPGHPLREAILAEPDFLSPLEAAVKIPFYLRMLGRLHDD